MFLNFPVSNSMNEKTLQRNRLLVCNDDNSLRACGRSHPAVTVRSLHMYNCVLQ